MLKRIKLLVRRFVKKRFSLIEKPSDTTNIVDTLKNTVQIVPAKETLSTIQKAIENDEKGAYLRFGDGDVFLLSGKNDQLQEGGHSLQLEMMDVFKIAGKGIYKSLSLNSEIFGYEKGMFDGNHLLSNTYALNILQKVYIYFVGQKIYSPVALHFMASNQPKIANQFLRILKPKTGLLIANEKTSEKTKKLLFGDVPFVKTPSTNSYSEMDRIFKEAKEELSKCTEYRVVVIAMGCSGRILMKRLLNEGYNTFFFDFGSLLDGFDGNKSRAWLELSNIDYQVLAKDL